MFFLRCGGNSQAAQPPLQAEMESIQSFYNNDSKKLTQLNAPSRQPGDISFFNRTDPIGKYNAVCHR
jgi:hypothetical protein